MVTCFSFLAFNLPPSQQGRMVAGLISSLTEMEMTRRDLAVPYPIAGEYQKQPGYSLGVYSTGVDVCRDHDNRRRSDGRGTSKI